MQTEGPGEPPSRLYDEDYNIMAIQIAIPPRDHEGMRLSECSVAYPWYAEIDELTSSKLPGSRDFNVNLNGTRHVYNHGLAEWFADFDVSVENTPNPENVRGCPETRRHKQI